jgi:hypothetical protein
MFATKVENSNTTAESTEANTTTAVNKYKNIFSISNTNDDETNYSNLDKMLENEKQKNKAESWNKLDKTVKIQKLHQFAEKYGKDNALPQKDIKSLKTFFSECLNKNKIQKAKDVNYNKDSQEITSIPSLFFNTLSRNFTLKNTDAKRVSTLKSLTPKRITPSIHDQL